MPHRLLLPLAAVALALIVPLAACPSIKLDPANHYACDRSGKDPSAACPEGAHCGVEGFCYAIADAGAVFCEQGRDDCAPDWRCDLSTATCRQRTPGAYACALDGGLPSALSDAGISSDDLCEGWRCGIDGICHPRDPGPYRCRADSDCEGGWRCGPEGLCRDPSSEAILWDKLPGDGGVTRLNPEFLSAAPVRVAVAPPASFVGSELSETGWDEGFALSMELPTSSLTTTPIAHLRQRWPNQNAAPGASLEYVVGKGAVLGTVLDLEATTSGPVVLSNSVAGTFVRRYAIDVDGTLQPTAQQWDTSAWKLTPSTLRVLESKPFTGFVSGFGAASGHLFSATKDLDVAMPSQFATNETFRDATPFVTWVYPLFIAFDVRNLLLATNAGLYGLQIDPAANDSFKDPVVCSFDSTHFASIFPDPSLAGITVDVQLRATPEQKYEFGGHSGLLALRSLQTQNASVSTTVSDSLFLFRRGGSSNGTCNPNDFPQTLVFGPCANPCGGLELRNFVPAWEDDGFGIDVECGPAGSAGATTAVRVTGSNATCTTRQLVVDGKTVLDDLVSAPMRGGVHAYATRHGAIVAGANPEELLDITPAHTPAVFVHDVEGLDVLPISPRSVLFPLAPLGYASVDPQLPDYLEVVGAVGTRPWAVHRAGIVTDLGDRVFATLDSSVHDFSPPYHADVLPERGGDGGFLTLTAFDQVLSARFDEQAFAADAGTDGGSADGGDESLRLDQRFTPAAGAALVGLAPDPSPLLPDGGTALAGGYIATRDRVWRFYAETERKWKTVELAPPTEDARTLWTDRFGRARIAFKDGSIYSLPTFFSLAPAVPSELGVADVIDVCGQPWAVTSDGVYRLVRDPKGPLGAWERLVASGDPIGEWPLEGLNDARLVVGDERVLLFGGFGDVIEFKVPGCHGGKP